VSGDRNVSIENPHGKFSNFAEILRYRAIHQPEKTAYIYLADGESESVRVSYQQLDQHACAIAARLQAIGAPSRRALLLYQPGLDYIAAFFGCLYAGVTAVPAYPPHPRRPFTRLRAIAADSQAEFVLTTIALFERIESIFSTAADLTGLKFLATDSIETAGAAAWRQHVPRGDTLAFLQYTSGSTSTPKGVMVSHANLLYTLTDLDRAWDHTPNSIMVTWLPTFHDLGLIYGVLLPAYRGFLSYLFAPASFLQRPIRWLQAISSYGATHSAAPNFAYELCLRKTTPAERAELDLSSWQVALNAAEPVRADTLQRFAAAFEPSGFRLEVFCPGYGLAEASVKVSAERKRAGPVLYRAQAAALEQHRLAPAADSDPTAQTIVGCGWSEIGATIRIVDPQTHIECPSDRIGEIWVASKSVAQGYWNNPQETTRTFGAHLADSGAGPFLRTGDLGFARQGELFITGRHKDLLIIRGRNHYPHDIELTAEESHPALRSACGAAFSVDADNEEHLVLVQEIKRTHLKRLDAEAVGRAIRSAIVKAHDIQVQAIMFIKTGAILKTPSGKIQRQACRVAYLENRFPVVGSWRAPAATLQAAARPHGDMALHGALPTVETVERWIADWLSSELRISANSIDSSIAFADYGVDSILAVELAYGLQDWLEHPLEIEKTVTWNFPTIKSLARYVSAALRQTDTNSDSQAGPSVGSVGQDFETAQRSSADELEGHSEAELTELLAAETVLSRDKRSS